MSATCHDPAPTGPAVPTSDEERTALLLRLRRVEGQVRGIQRMVEQDKYCIDILTQIAAVSRALDQVGLQILDRHVRGCVRQAMVEGDGEDDAKIKELMDAVSHFARTK